jgi:hypothetical protein
MIERLGPLILIAGLAAAVAHAFGPPSAVTLAVAVVVGVVALVPVGGLSATDLVFSFTGPLSGAALVLMATGMAALFWPDRATIATFGVPVLAGMVVVVAVPLHAATIAGTVIDPYRWGYGGWVLPAGVLVLLLVGFLAGAPAVAAWVAVSGVLYLAGAYASRNLFDYLVDPVALVFALVFLGQAALARLSP